MTDAFWSYFFASIPATLAAIAALIASLRNKSAIEVARKENKQGTVDLGTKVDGNTVVTATMAAAKGVVGADDKCVEATAAKLSNGNKDAVTKYAKDAIGTATAVREAEQLPPHNNETLMILVEQALTGLEERMAKTMSDRDVQHKANNEANRLYLDEVVRQLRAELGGKGNTSNSL